MTYNSYHHSGTLDIKLLNSNLGSNYINPDKSIIRSTGFFNNYDAIKFNTSNSDYVLSRFVDFTTCEDWIHILRSRSTRNIDIAILDFHVALFAYWKSTKKDDYYDIYRNCALLGPAYATELKKLRMECFLKSESGLWIERDQMYPEGFVVDFPYRIFPYQLLLHWSQPDEEDYLYGEIDVIIDDEYLTRFKSTLEEIIPVVDLEIDSDALRCKGLGSKSLDGDKSSLRFFSKLKENGFSSEPLSGRRMFLDLSPENTRDIVVLPNETLNSISLIDSTIEQIVGHMPTSAQGKSHEETNRIIRQFHDRSYHYLSRDFRKEGITKPRELIKAILEVLKNLYPKYSYIWDLGIKVYSAYNLEVNGKIHSMKRGHGLGMANSLTTLMNIGLFHLTLNEMYDNYAIETDAEALCFNDDFISRFSDRSHLDFYLMSERKVFKSLSVMVNPKKSFYIEGGFLFLERYFTYRGEDPKDPLREYLAAAILSLDNIVRAKEYYASFPHDERREYYIKFVPDIFGYEFFEDELSIPIIFGGWINTRFNSVDLSCNGEVRPEFYKSYKACRASVMIPYKKKRNKIISKSFFHDFYPYVEDLRIEEFYDGWNHEEILNEFTSNVRSMDDLKLYYRKLFNERRRIFNSSRSVEIGVMLEEIIDQNPYIDFISKEHGRPLEIKEVGREYEKLFHSSYPFDEFVRSKYNFDLRDYKCSQWFHLKRKPQKRYKFMQRLNDFNDWYGLLEEPDIETSISNSLDKFTNPAAVYGVCKSLGWTSVYYIKLKPPEYIEELYKIYNSLDIEMLNELSKFNLDNIIIRTFRHLYGEDALECLEFYIQKLAEYKTLLNEFEEEIDPELNSLVQGIIDNLQSNRPRKLTSDDYNRYEAGNLDFTEEEDNPAPVEIIYDTLESLGLQRYDYGLEDYQYRQHIGESYDIKESWSEHGFIRGINNLSEEDRVRIANELKATYQEDDPPDDEEEDHFDPWAALEDQYDEEND
jgi:hypothetical protein